MVVVPYKDYGFNYLPLPQGTKKEVGASLPPWKDFQRKKYPGPEPIGNRAIITGSYDPANVRPLIVLDIDHPPENFDLVEFLKHSNLPDTYKVRTGNGGIHLYYLTDCVDSYDKVYGNRSGKQQNSDPVRFSGMSIDVRGQGGLVYAPPTQFDVLHIKSAGSGLYEHFGDSFLSVVGPQLFDQFFKEKGHTDVPSPVPERKVGTVALSLTALQTETLAVECAGIHLEKGERSKMALSLSAVLRKRGVKMEDSLSIIARNKDIVAAAMEDGKTVRDYVERTYNKPLSDISGNGVGKTFPNFVKVLNQMGNPMHHPAIDAIIQTLSDMPIHWLEDRAIYLVYNDGIWEKRTNLDWLPKRLLESMSFDHFRVKQPVITNMLKAIVYELKGREPHLGFGDFSSFGKLIKEDNKAFINLKNGVLEVDLVRRSTALVAHSPDYMFTSRLDIVYTKDARSKIWEDSITSSIRKEDSEMFYDYLGYTLLSWDTGWQAALYVHGVPGSGKSTILSSFIEAFGNHNCDTYNKNDPFNLSGLLYSDIWFIDEWEDKQQLDNTVQRLFSSDKVSLRPLYKQPVEKVHPFKVLVASNYPPVFKNDAHARRYVMVNFPNALGKRLKDIRAHLKDDLDAFVSYLLDTKIFSYLDNLDGYINSQIDRNKAIVETMNTGVESFFADSIKRFAGSELLISEVHRRYEVYMREKGITPLSKAAFGRIFIKAFNPARGHKKEGRTYKDLAFIGDPDPLPFPSSGGGRRAPLGNKQKEIAKWSPPDKDILDFTYEDLEEEYR